MLFKEAITAKKKSKLPAIPQIDNYRLVAYNQKTIQVVRNLNGFIDYHIKNPGTLQYILTQMIVACTQPEHTLGNRIRQSRANRDYQLVPIHPAKDIVNANGKTTRISDREYTYAELMDISTKWIKGIIMQAYGPKGFDVIKEAETDALSYFSIK